MSAWPLVALGDVCDIGIGRTPSRSERAYWGHGHPWLSIADMNQGRNITSTKEQITNLGAKTMGAIVPARTVLFSFKLSIGKVGMSEFPLYTNEAIAALPIRGGVSLTVDYLYWALRSSDFGSDANRAAMGKTLNKAQLRRATIPLPPLDEQRRIAGILDRADALRAKRRESLAVLDDLTQSIFLDMFGRPGDGELAWPMTTVGAVAEVQGGIQVTSARSTYTRQVPYLRVANVYRGFLDLREIKKLGVTDREFKRTALQTGDLLIVEGHGNPQEIGRAALWHREIDGCIHQNHLIRARFDRSQVLPEFAETYINSAVGRRYLLKSGKTTSGLNTISTSNVKSAPITMPPLVQQERFAQALRHAEEDRGPVERSSEQLYLLFSSLQHRAFAGEL